MYAVQCRPYRYSQDFCKASRSSECYSFQTGREALRRAGRLRRGSGLGQVYELAQAEADRSCYFRMAARGELELRMLCASPATPRTRVTAAEPTQAASRYAGNPRSRDPGAWDLSLAMVLSRRAP